MKLFSSTDGVKLVSAKYLGNELARLKTIISSKTNNGKGISKAELGNLFNQIRKIVEQGIYKTFNRSDLAIDKE